MLCEKGTDGGKWSTLVRVRCGRFCFGFIVDDVIDVVVYFVVGIVVDTDVAVVVVVVVVEKGTDGGKWSTLVRVSCDRDIYISSVTASAATLEKTLVNCCI